MKTALPMLLLALSAGCTPAIVGDWDLHDWSINGESLSGQVYGSLTIDDDLEGEFELTAEGETFEGDAEAEQTDDGDWSLDLTAQGDTIELDCEIDDDTLSCDTDQDGFHYDIEWERD